MMGFVGDMALGACRDLLGASLVVWQRGQCLWLCSCRCQEQGHRAGSLQERSLLSPAPTRAAPAGPVPLPGGGAGRDVSSAGRGAMGVRCASMGLGPSSCP